MEKCRMNYQGVRPYYPPNREMPARDNCRRTPCGCNCNCDMVDNTSIYEHADKLPLTMAYVPMQKFKTTFELCKALQMGTISLNFASHSVEREVDVDEGMQTQQIPVNAADQ